MKNTFLYILAVFTFVSVANAQEKLDYDLHINDTFKVVQKATQDIIQEMNGSQHEMKNELEADYTFIVKKVTDNGFVIDFTFDRFKMTTTSNLYGEIMSVDTNEEADEDEMTMTLNGTQNTSMKAGMKNGFVQSMKVTSEAIGTTVMKQMNGVEIPTTIKSITEYKIQ